MGYLFASVLDSSNIPKVTPNQSLLQSVLTIFIGIATGLSVVYGIIAALRFSASNGDAAKIAQARKTLIYAVAGLIVSVSSLAIVSIVQGVGTSVAGAGDPITGPDGIISVVVDWLSAAVGIVSVISIIIGGIRFTQSNGTPAVTQAARQTIVYAVVGLILSFVVPFIVGFALNSI